MAVLITEDRAFETAMIKEYPDVLKAGQVEKIPIGYRQKAYIFTGLRREVIESFLKKYKSSKDTLLCHIGS